jgi:tetratricopeptide (TPR) repeat protein
MNKVRFSKILYILIIVIFVTSIFLIYRKIEPPYNSIFIAIAMVICFIPGRIVGHYFRYFFIARKFLNLKKYENSIEYNKRFIQLLEHKPWIKRLMWFSWGIYTKDIEAMSFNNLGTALLYMGKYDQSKEQFKKAISIDESYSLPYFNLAIIYLIDGDKEIAHNYYRNAEKLGFKGTSFDKLITKIQELYTNREGNINE